MKILELNNAYDILKDPVKRNLYDLIQAMSSISKKNKREQEKRERQEKERQQREQEEREQETYRKKRFAENERLKKERKKQQKAGNEKNDEPIVKNQKERFFLIIQIIVGHYFI